MWDSSFLAREIPSIFTSAVPILTLIYHRDYSISEAVDTQFAEVQNIMLRRQELKLATKLHAPPLPQRYGTHHSKYVIVKASDRLRVSILSSNMR